MKAELIQYGIEAELIDSNGQYGGGSLPGKTIKSYSLVINYGGSRKDKKGFCRTHVLWTP